MTIPTEIRVLGVDFGEKRIGLAVSDPSGTVATPLGVVTRRAGKRLPLSKIQEAVADLQVDHVVVGLPLGLDGEENEWCAEVRTGAERLAERLDADVSFVDERLTSVRAERAVRGIGLPKRERERRERVDVAAAQLILQAWLDRPEIAR